MVEKKRMSNPLCNQVVCTTNAKLKGLREEGGDWESRNEGAEGNGFNTGGGAKRSSMKNPGREKSS